MNYNFCQQHPHNNRQTDWQITFCGPIMRFAFYHSVGFMAYNALAGGMLTGKYMDRPAAIDNVERSKVIEAMENPRGRHDELGWGRTLYRYRSEAAQEAIAEYAKIAKVAGVSLTELSLLWCRQRSLITTTLVGHSNMDQLQESIKFFTKSDPLPENVMWEIDVSLPSVSTATNTIASSFHSAASMTSWPFTPRLIC